MSNYKVYFAIEKQLKRQGFEVNRFELIGLFTSGKKTGLSELSPFQYKQFILWLGQRFHLRQASSQENQASDRMRKKLIHYFKYEMGYTLEGINNWCIKYGSFHKPLNDHTKSELAKLISIVEGKVYPEYMQKLTNKG